MISINQFMEIDLRVATIISAERVPETDKLMKIVLTLAGEVSVLRERLDALERVLEADGGFRREDLDGYVATLENNPGAQEPVQFIGPAFALNCGDREDLMLAMTGSKIFASVLSQVKSYLTALELC